ncbi:unnamed protein product [Callosobruchus maculatus]|uniref:Uncharacterized protein n=1 Tax=Callosobruchus maculatus TaxID=64391 RepID=A0A653C5Q9_CALMS|nr:unnamed protein product [Callosobruchus maculatus]
MLSFFHNKNLLRVLVMLKGWPLPPYGSVGFMFTTMLHLVWATGGTPYEYEFPWGHAEAGWSFLSDSDSLSCNALSCFPTEMYLDIILADTVEILLNVIPT